MIKQKKSWADTFGLVIGLALAAFAGLAWYDHTFNPEMTYMCRYYIGEHPVGGDAYLDASTLDSVMACRLDQRRYGQEFRPIRSCTTEDMEYLKADPKHERYCLDRT
jgi:hypothetical protein